MNHKMLILSPDDLAIVLQSLQVMITHISITDTDTYMKEFKEKIETVIQKMIV